MPPKPQKNAHVTSSAPTAKAVIGSMFNTLELLLPHAARLVEEKTQSLVEDISRLVTASRAQEDTIAQLVACVQHMRSTNREMPMQDYLKRMEVSLAFSLETNRSVAYASEKWLTNLDEQTAQISGLTSLLEPLRAHAQPMLADSLEELRKTLEASLSHLQTLRQEIAQSLPSARDCKLYSDDMKLLATLINEQPARTSQLFALLQDANANARTMADAGRAAIMAVQFQDYHMQLQDHAMRLLRLLRDSCLGTQTLDGAALAEACNANLTLGEIRKIFTDGLAAPANGNGVSFVHETTGNHIELF